MAETQIESARPDIDIEEDIRSFIVRYPPLANDRHHIHASASDGVVTLTGYVKTRNSYRYLLTNLPYIEGVRAINNDRFYNDEAIRLEVGRVIPTGVQVNTEYGAVILAGKLPDSIGEDHIVQKVAQIPGVHRVIRAFH